MKKQTWKMHFNKGVPCRNDWDPYDKESDDNEFEEDLFFTGYERIVYTSEAVMVLMPYADRNKRCYNKKTHYTVFMRDTVSIIKHMIHGRIKGTFVWVKDDGGNYGIQLKEKAE